MARRVARHPLTAPMLTPQSLAPMQAALREAALDGWLLYTQDSPSTRGGRGFTRGTIYGQDGTLIASVAQEGLIRLRHQPS